MRTSLLPTSQRIPGLWKLPKTKVQSPPLIKKEFACASHCIFSAKSFEEMGSPEAFAVCNKAVSPASGRLTQLSPHGSGITSLLTANWHSASQRTSRVVTMLIQLRRAGPPRPLAMCSRKSAQAAYVDSGHSTASRPSNTIWCRRAQTIKCNTWMQTKEPEKARFPTQGAVLLAIAKRSGWFKGTHQEVK